MARAGTSMGRGASGGAGSAERPDRPAAFGPTYGVGKCLSSEEARADVGVSKRQGNGKYPGKPKMSRTGR